MINRAQVRGDEAGEEIVMGSVVYMGRDSFRMETVVETFDDGAPREVTGIVTSPYRTRAELPANDSLAPTAIDEDATEIIARARRGEWRVDEQSAPSLPDPLFGSQTDLPISPILSAPTERIFARRPRRVSLSRGALALAGISVFVCGLASGAFARHATSGARPTVVAAHEDAKTPLKAPAPEPVAAVPTEPASAGLAVMPTVIELPQPILVRIHAKKTAALSTNGARRAAPAPAIWVDPFAD